MKALAINQPGNARVIELPEPHALIGEALLKVSRVGLCGTDLSTFRGKNPLVTYPRVLGHEVAAELTSDVALGNKLLLAGSYVTLNPYTACGKCASCQRFRANACEYNETLGVQRDGALTAYVAHPADKMYAGSLSLQELCLVEPLTVGFHAVSRGGVTENDTVAVFGVGGVGIGAISGASRRKARVIAIDVDEGKLDLARRAGAEHAIHAMKENVHTRLRELTGGFGPQCIIEAIGRPDTFRAAVDEVAFSGRVVYIGYAKEPISYETKLFVQKELDILGSRNALPQDFCEVIGMLEAGAFPTEGVVTAVVHIDDAPEILREWDSHPERFSKIQVTLD
jgi:threonine dehydrogenase-like Zn-dependent dehydrogenase